MSKELLSFLALAFTIIPQDAIDEINELLSEIVESELAEEGADGE